MKRRFRILALFLSLLLLLPWDAARAAGNGGGASALEQMAIDYVTKYVNTAYLYESEDFVAGTLLELLEETLARLGISRLKVNGTNVEVEDLRANLRQFGAVADYYRYTRSVKGFGVEELELSFSEISTEISGNSAQVDLYKLVSFRYSDFTQKTYLGGQYTVYFSKINGKWYISEIWSESMYFGGLTRDLFDVEDAIRRFNKTMGITLRKPAKFLRHRMVLLQHQMTGNQFLVKRAV